MEKFNHIELNNEVTKRGDNGFFRLEKDQEAIAEFLREVDYKTVKFLYGICDGAEILKGVRINDQTAKIGDTICFDGKGLSVERR